MILSKKMRDAYKLDKRRAYQIAKLAEMHPSTVSQIMNEMIPIGESDERVMKIAKILGVSMNDIFNKTPIKV